MVAAHQQLGGGAQLVQLNSPGQPVREHIAGSPVAFDETAKNQNAVHILQLRRLLGGEDPAPGDPFDIAVDPQHRTQPQNGKTQKNAQGDKEYFLSLFHGSLLQNQNSRSRKEECHPAGFRGLPDKPAKGLLPRCQARVMPAKYSSKVGKPRDSSSRASSGPTYR